MPWSGQFTEEGAYLGLDNRVMGRVRRGSKWQVRRPEQQVESSHLELQAGRREGEWAVGKDFYSKSLSPVTYSFNQDTLPNCTQAWSPTEDKVFKSLRLWSTSSSNHHTTQAWESDFGSLASVGIHTCNIRAAEAGAGDWSPLASQLCTISGFRSQ